MGCESPAPKAASPWRTTPTTDPPDPHPPPHPLGEHHAQAHHHPPPASDFVPPPWQGWVGDLDLHAFDSLDAARAFVEDLLCELDHAAERSAVDGERHRDEPDPATPTGLLDLIRTAILDACQEHDIEIDTDD